LRQRVVTALRLAALLAAIPMLLAAAARPAAAQVVLQITNPLFPLTPVGQQVTENVQLTVASGGNQVIYSLIRLAPGASDYTIGTITGCVVDGSTPNLDGTTCIIPITFQPSLPGNAASPQPIARTVALQVFDTENGNGQEYSLGLIGGGTMPRAVVVPGTISDLVGNDTTLQTGFGGDGGPASGAIFNAPSNMAVDNQGNIYISDTANCVVRRVDAVTRIVSTYAGLAPSPAPNCGAGTDGTYPTGSQLNGNTGIALDAAGNLYIADTGNGAIRMVSPVTGVIITVAGQLNFPGYGGDGGSAIQAQLNSPTGIAVDGFGDIFIADSGNFIVREVSPATGYINTVAGKPQVQGNPSVEAFGIPATSFLLANPQQVTVDSVGNLYIADASTQGVLQVLAATQNMNLIYQAVGIPTSVAVDASDTLHFTLAGLCGVYKLPQGASALIPIAGNGACIPSGDGGSALSAGLNSPNGVVVDGTGSLYILESDGVRFVDSTGTNPLSLAFGSEQIYAVSNPENVLLFNGDVPLPMAATPNPLGVYFSGNVNIPFATITPGTGAVDCSTATAAVSIPLNPAAYCSLSITFTPQVDSPFAGGTSLFEYLPGTATQVTQTINLSGTGTGVPATAGLTPPSAMLMAGVAGGVAMQSFLLTNTGGGAPLTVTSVSFANSAVTGFSQANNCTSALARSASCTIVVQYAPTAGGSVSQTLVVTDNVSGGQTTAALTGVGVLPTATLTPGSQNFTGVANEGGQELSFTLTNTSATAYLVLSAIYFPTYDGFSVDNTTTCISVLAPGANCLIEVEFGPTATGSPTNTLTVLDNTAAGTETATVNGTATAPFATLSGVSLFFGSTQPGTQSASQMVTLTNTGTSPLNISSVVLNGTHPEAFTLAPNPCPTSLAINASCNIVVSFTPQAPGNLLTAQISILDDSGGQHTYSFVTQTILLTGTAPTPVQTSSFTIADNAFPSTPVSVVESQNVLLTLNSTSTVLKSIAMAPGFTEYVVNSISGCTADGVTVNPAGTICSINIAFTPSSIGSQHNATLMATTIESGLPVPYAFGLTGQSTGTIAALTPGIIEGYLSSNGMHGGSVSLPGGMNGPAIDANVGFFGGFALDSAHNLYVSDTDFGLIYKVNPQGIVNIYATAASQRPLLLLALDSSGSLYADETGGLVKIDAATTINTNVLSTDIPCSMALDSYGDGCPRNQVAYAGANGMAFGPDGNLYFSTVYGIHELNFQTNQVTLYAGSGNNLTEGAGVDGGPALGAAMIPTAVTFDSNGNLLFIDNTVQVRSVNKGSGTITTVAGASNIRQYSGGVPIGCTNGAIDTAQFHSAGNGGPATAATFCGLTGLAVDPANNIYVVDMSASEIRRIDSGTGIIVEVSGQNSILGIETGDSTTNRPLPGQDGSARDASLLSPMNVLVDGSANVYVMSETGNVRMINVSESALDFTPYFDTNPPYNRESIGIGSMAGPQQVTVVNAGNTGTVSFNAPFTNAPLFGISTADYVRDTANPDCISTNAALAPGTECPINIDFTPTIAGSPIQDTETVNDTGGAQTITLIGYASGVAPVALTPGLLIFGGAVGVTTPPQTFTLTNNMPGAIGLGGITLIGVNPNAFSVSNNCGASLAANSSCLISVTFTAPSLGNFLAQVDVVYTQTFGATVFPTTLLGGLLGLGGTPEGQFVIDSSLTSPADFAPQNVGVTSPVHSFQFTSTGNVPLIISAVTLTGTNPNQFAIASNTCFGPMAVSPTLAPGATCTIGVTFKPTADSPTSPATPFTAMLSVADNAPDTPQQITLYGTGVGQPPAVLNIMETITTTDTVPTPVQAMRLNIMESITTTDTVPTPVQAMTLNIMESITTTDTVPTPVQAMTLNITESIKTSDADSITTALIPTTAQLELSSVLLPVGGSENLVVTVSPVQATGTVNIYDGTTLLATGPLTSGTFTYSTAGLTPGIHFIQGFYLGSSTYAASSTHNLQVVVQATLTVTAQSLSRSFGTANPALSYQITGFVNGDTSLVVGGSPALSTTAVLNSSSGSYPIVVSQGTLSAPSYYTFSFVNGTLTVNSGAAQTITFSTIPNLPLVVGKITLTAHSTSGLPITYSVAGPATVSGSVVTLTGTGLVTVTASQPGNATFAPATSVVRSFTVTP